MWYRETSFHSWHHFQALAVFILYIRCTSINPADPGIMARFEDGFIDVPANSDGLEGINLPQKANSAIGTHSPTSTCRSSLDGHSNQRGTSIGEANIHVSSQLPKKRSSCFLFGGLVCALFVKEDCRKLDDSEQQASGEEALFCTLCNAEVCFFSFWLCSMHPNSHFGEQAHCTCFFFKFKKIDFYGLKNSEILYTCTYRTVV